MKTARRLVLISWLLLGQAAGVGAQTAGPSALEVELSAKMLALSSAIRGGMTHQDYVRRVPELTALYERWERSGGTNAELQTIHRNFLEAKLAWDRLVDLRNRRGPQAMSTPESRAAEKLREKPDEDLIQRNWRNVIEQLSTLYPADPQSTARSPNSTPP